MEIIEGIVALFEIVFDIASMGPKAAIFTLIVIVAAIITAVVYYY